MNRNFIFPILYSVLLLVALATEGSELKKRRNSPEKLTADRKNGGAKAPTTTIQSPSVTDWGDWNEWDTCSTSTYVVGFRLKTENDQGKGDDTALNGIELQCATIGSNQNDSVLCGKVGDWGEWGQRYRCPSGSVLTGFQLRSERDQRDADVTAANNFRGFCSSATSHELTPSMVGDGLARGDWSERQNCPSGYGICGMRTQVQGWQSSGDDTALNNVAMQCCLLATTIRSPSVTDWGDWYEWGTCEPGEFVVGFRLKTEQNQGEGDDTALNGIELQCATIGSTRNDTVLVSKYLKFGEWGQYFRCPVGSVLTGFQLRSERDQGDKDSTAANNFKGYCSSITSHELTHSMVGDGLAHGDWSERQNCPSGYGICGMRTQVQEWQFSDDDTALNNVSMQCCLLPAVIQSPSVTDWGDWSDWEVCEAHKYVVGFQLKTEKKQGQGDNTALNGIELQCVTIGSNQNDSVLRGKVGNWGEWGRKYRCPSGSVLTGFQLRSEGEQGDEDDTAANNFKGICSSTISQALTHSIVGDSLSWGYWSAQQNCPTDHGICGKINQVQSQQWTGDDTALNNVAMKCCLLPSATATAPT